MSDRIFRSQETAQLEELYALEYDEWSLPDEITFPKADVDGVFTWEVRRLRRPETHNRDDFHRAQKYWDRLRNTQRWALEQPMMLTAKFYVKRVVVNRATYGATGQ